VNDPVPYVEGGRALLDLHISYEEVDPYPLSGSIDLTDNDDVSDATDAYYAVQKMAWANVRGADKKLREDKTTLVYNSHITPSGNPKAAHRSWSDQSLPWSGWLSGIRRRWIKPQALKTTSTRGFAGSEIRLHSRPRRADRDSLHKDNGGC
jgi:hypothetical protein